jgi:hypothetical protein
MPTTAQGTFELGENGVLTGGSPGFDTVDARLIVVDSPGAAVAGTIRPEVDGQAAHMVINGTVDLAAGSRIEVDVPVSGPIPAEQVRFLRANQVLGGTLAVNVMTFPPERVEHRVISTNAGSGSFAEITGAEDFYEIVEVEQGVLLKR